MRTRKKPDGSWWPSDIECRRGYHPWRPWCSNANETFSFWLNSSSKNCSRGMNFCCPMTHWSENQTRCCLRAGHFCEQENTQSRYFSKYLNIDSMADFFNSLLFSHHTISRWWNSTSAEEVAWFQRLIPNPSWLASGRISDHQKLVSTFPMIDWWW